MQNYQLTWLKKIMAGLQIFVVWNNGAGKQMRVEVHLHILVNCPIDTFLQEKQHSALGIKG